MEGYSRGMKQRLHVARGLLHDPPVLFLDEPTIGLDPVGARELRAMIASLAEGGKTVLLTTHYMFEADALCDRIAVIAKGRIVAEGTPGQLKAQVAEGHVVEVETFGIDERALARIRSLAGREVGVGGGARAGAGAHRPVGVRRRTDRGDPRQPGRRRRSAAFRRVSRRSRTRTSRS